MRLAMIGCGYVANMYRLTLPLHPELELVGVLDRDPVRASNMGELTSAKVYRDIDELLLDDTVDLVLNLTNPTSHYELTLACLNAGKHVYTEKPLALRLEQAKELVEVAERKGLQLSSAPCTLLNPAAQSVWKALREEPVGPIRLVYAEMEDGMVQRMPVRKWINEAGVPWPYRDEFETGCTIEHAGYVLTWLAAFFGPAHTVSAFSTTIAPDKLPGEDLQAAQDLSMGCIMFDNGVVARLTCGVYAPVDHAMRFFGDEGVIEVADPRNDKSRIRMQRYITVRRRRMLSPWRRRYPLVGAGKKEVRYRGSQRRDFCAGIADMAEAIAGDRPCRLSARFCLHVNEITLALHNALDQASPCRMTTRFTPVEPMPWGV